MTTPALRDVSMPRPLLKAKQVAERLGLSVEMVYKLRTQGLLPCKKIGATYRWRPEVVDEFMRAP